ncbi:MAG TPA: hypothetical protein ENN90_01860 [Mariniphaga anaerophila]|uniref:Curlin associated repeat-containing protein n=1 Tax=Mariniphaga anaerophila TaxID=1484053 RepID=A0A831LIP1_9BACT|nr:hypothetical protein [Mariniphaga anaerophila]
MKKLVFFFAMVFAASMVMGQNTVDLTQTGANQESTVDQAGINDAKVTQFTDNDGVQKSTIKQNGLRNDVIVEQNQTGGGGNQQNTAFIQQIGNDNFGKQYENAPGYNGGQHATAYQTGNLNDVRQSIFSGYTEALYTWQEGNENDAIQEATGGGHNYGNIYQWGNENWAKQEIFGTNQGSGAADILIEQDGSLNKARQLFTQGGFSQRNNGEIYQNGWRNDAFQEGAGTWLDLQLWQNGHDNKSTQKSWGNDNTSWLVQSGDDHVGTIIQDGDNNSTKLNQSGSGKVNVLQEGNSNNIAGIDAACEIMEWGYVYNLVAKQYGELNKLYINSNGTVNVMQDNTAAATMNGNMIKYYQSGTGITKLSQVGDENVVGLLHGGNGNVDIKQAGDGNAVASFVDVFASDPVMSTPCCGTFNGVKLDVDQLGEGNLLHLASTGGLDVIDVLQSGNNNAASVTQSATVIQ